jgi:hypothetical protein
MRVGLLARTGFRLAARTVLAGVRRRVEVVRFDTSPRARPPFQLPFRISAVGDVASDVVKHVTQEKAIKIAYVQLPEHLRDQACPHIVVVRGEDLSRTLLSAFHHAPDAETPALVVSLGGVWPLFSRASRVPDGTAVYAIRRNDASIVLPRIVENIARDLPLERAIKEAARQKIGRRRGSLLVIDRGVNDALRVADAAEMDRIERERAGLTPSSEKITELWQITSGPPEASPAVGGAYKGFSRNGQQVVDINIMRSTYRNDRNRMLKRGTTLQCATDYFLVVHTGKRLSTSIVREQDEIETSADNVQGDADVLDLVIQEKELKLSSGGHRQLTVPRADSSKMVFFTVRTPDATGTAGLRLMLYRRNEMLQSYSIEAEITEREVDLEADDRGATAVLDFSQTADLRSASTLTGRALTVTVNRNSSNTHAIFIKGEEGAASLSIPESSVVEHLRAFRQILLDASYADDAHTEPRRWLETPGDDAKDIIKRLARLGRTLYREYLDDSEDKVATTLNTIRAGSDLVITIVRYHERFAFPWPIFYDRLLPRLPFGDVCFGETAPGVPCNHDDRSRAYCIRGFWGYRHQIEELIGNRKPQNRVSELARPTRPGSLSFLIDKTVAFDPDVVQTLTSLVDSDSIRAVDSRALLERMWDPGTRPAMLVVLGHLYSKEKDGEPLEPRIPLPATSDGPDWLLSNDILESITERRPWTAPNPIVLLLTCESGATSPDELSGFVAAFHRARASAIIGTECLALSDCVDRFSVRFIPMVWQRGISLGKAMTQVRRALLEQGYPLVFVFSCVGRADLKVVSQSAAASLSKPITRN